MHASDRKLTWVDRGGRPSQARQPILDAPKIMIVDRSVVVSYSGWERLEGTHALSWFVRAAGDKIKGKLWGDTLRAVADRLARLYMRRPPLRAMSQTFLVTGYFAPVGGSAHIPRAFVVTTAYTPADPPGQWDPRKMFYASKPVGNRRVVVEGVGPRTLGPHLARAQRHLRRLQDHGSSPATVGRAFVDAAFKRPYTNERLEAIGRSSMLVTMPKTAVTNKTEFCLGAPRADRISMTYVPDASEFQIADLNKSAIWHQSATGASFELLGFGKADVDAHDFFPFDRREP